LPLGNFESSANIRHHTQLKIVNLLEILTYLSAILIGFVLGLLGGGGSILSVPVFVYFLSIPAYEATAYSLFVVGVTSFAGSATYIKKKLVDLKIALLLSLPSFIGVLVSRKIILPNLPDVLFSIGNFVITKNLAIMILFSILMILASISMIKKSNNKQISSTRYSLFIKFFFVGVFLGLVGAGGGFLIIPSLIFFAKLEMKAAVGTSLLIIAANSLTGFFGDLTTSLVFDWNLLFLFTAFALLGILIGTKVSDYIDNRKLKPIFGWFVLVIGIYIIVKELLVK
jgi:uncharacterized membrane protein YfcA